MAPEKQKQIKKGRKDPKTDLITPPSTNVVIPEQHPLLNPLIVELVLIFSKGAHGTNKDKTFFQSLRLVCKLWDIEVCKILRPNTQISLPRLLMPYPEGLGWRWNRSRKTPGYQYHSPYPDTPEFPNVKVTTLKTCKAIKDPKIIRWFKVMGGQVKSLEYSSALDCYHQNYFLGNCLQTWCPNLESLTLSGIQCFASLIYIFEGEHRKERKFERKGGFNCKKLRSLIISVENDKPVGEFNQCNDKRNYMLLSGRRIGMDYVNEGLENFSKFVQNLPEKDIERGGPFYELIERKADNLGKSYFDSLVVSKYFAPAHNFIWRTAIDWGVLGLILRVAPLQKIVLKKVTGKKQCRDLALFLLYQPSRLRMTLEHLEFLDCDVGRDTVCLTTLSLLKCPLKYLRLDNLLPSMEVMLSFDELLEMCAATLSTLEVDARAEEAGYDRLRALPNLKKFVNRNMTMLPLEGPRLLRKFPKLEICEFLDEGRNEQADDLRFAMSLFSFNLEEIAELGHPLATLNIGGCGGLRFEQIYELAKGLDNLRKVDLEVEGTSGLEFLLEWMGRGWGGVEEFKCVIGGGDRDGEDERWSDAFSQRLRNAKSLKFLELDFQDERTKLSKEAFENGFAKMEGLISLKINHYGAFQDDKEELENIVKHIPFVSLSQMGLIHQSI